MNKLNIQNILDQINKKMKKLFGILMLYFLLSTKASIAAITVDKYLLAMTSDNKKVHELIERNLMGINSGLMYANAELRFEKRKQIYCQPDKLAFNSQNLIQFVSDEIKFLQNKGMKIENVPIGMILVMHLKRVFPCK